MQVRCIRPCGRHKTGDLVDVPDGAQVSALYFAPPADQVAEGQAARSAPAAERRPPAEPADLAGLLGVKGSDR